MEMQRSALTQNLHFCKSKNVKSNSSEKPMLKHVHSLPGLVTAGTGPGTLRAGDRGSLGGKAGVQTASQLSKRRRGWQTLSQQEVTDSLRIFWRFNHLGFVTGVHGCLGTVRGLVCNTGMM